jgi:hypothetical protein
MIDLFFTPQIKPVGARLVKLANMDAPVEDPRDRKKPPKPKAVLHATASQRFREKHRERLNIERRIKCRRERIAICLAEIAELERRLEEIR